MRRATLCGLAVACTILLFGVSKPLAQSSGIDAGKVIGATPTVAVGFLPVCSLDNQVTTMGSEPLPHSQQLFSAAATKDCIPPSQCCKICSKGKACGNSCIRQDYTCHKAKGCACNQSEVCKK
jgi:hypothetical protein